MTTYIAYARVSTAKQGRSGLGLEAQQQAINAYLKPEDTLLAPTYVEVESGKRSDRPELAKALSHAKLTGATLLVAKLDRLARNVRFLHSVLESGVEVAFCDLPQVQGAMGRFIVNQMAGVAELEAGLISERTKAALKAAKERGVQLGGYRGGEKVDPSLGLAERQRRAEDFAARVRPVIAEAQATGANSLRQIASFLTEKGVQTRRGGPWDAAKVRNVMQSM
ncbi:recombinase family protein [Novosphingobium mathurense]|uniref:Site-specific DNA recombinase n=1 Tax=Novosphingobium mathurense TaxID=428990 RepID=A0A1U6HK02_9SPHN|nr:recombinase family protein [Novosphingobium mathurense]SLJ96088.1 Site-specific DNA recombinase [Novosphingobium mathurense]